MLHGLYYSVFHVEFEQHHRLTDSYLEKDMKDTAKIILANLDLTSIVVWDIKGTLFHCFFKQEQFILHFQS